MENKITFRPMESGEEKHIYELVTRVFHKQVAPVYTEKGVEKFLGMLSPEWLCETEKGEDSFVLVATLQNRLVGMLAVINQSHIALIFVDSGYQGKGIGNELINEAIRKCLEMDPSLKTITVSASPNSVSFYQTIGFQLTGEEVDEDGMRFIPMQREIILETR